MTKTIEEGILDVLIAMVIQCYKHYYIPWRDEKKVAYQNKKNEEQAVQRVDDKEEGVVSGIGNGDNENYSSLESIEADDGVPLSVQEESQHHSEHDRPVFNLREDIEGYLSGLPAHNAPRLHISGHDETEEGRSDEPLRFDFDKYFPWLDQEIPPERPVDQACLACGATRDETGPGSPSFPKNRTGVQMVCADEFVSRNLPAPPPVYVDNANRQVVIPQKTFETLISLIPWNNLPTNPAQLLSQQRDETATDEHANAQQNRLSAVVQATRPTDSWNLPTPSNFNAVNHPEMGGDCPDNHSVVGGANPVNHPNSGAASAPPIPTTIQINSAKNLAKFLRFRLTDSRVTTQKTEGSQDKEIRERLQQVKSSGIMFKLIDNKDKQSKGEAINHPPVSKTQVKLPDLTAAVSSNAGQRSPNLALFPNPLSSFVHKMATAPSMTSFPANQQVSGLVQNDNFILASTKNEIKTL